MSNNVAAQPGESQKAMLEAVAAATVKVLAETKSIVPSTTEPEKDVPADSAAIDLENETIEKKRQRQRSIVLNLGKKMFDIQRSTSFLFKEPAVTMPASSTTSVSSLDQPRRSFSTQSSSKPSFKGRHSDSSSSEEETSDTGGKDIDYAVLYDDTIEDFSFTSAREKAKQRLLRDQQEAMLKQIQEQE